jgi:hypothetical protein
MTLARNSDKSSGFLIKAPLPNRHHEKGKVQIAKGDQVDYLFWRLLVMIRFLVPHLKEERRSPRPPPGCRWPSATTTFTGSRNCGHQGRVPLDPVTQVTLHFVERVPGKSEAKTELLPSPSAGCDGIFVSEGKQGLDGGPDLILRGSDDRTVLGSAAHELSRGRTQTFPLRGSLAGVGRGPRSQ